MKVIGIKVLGKRVLLKRPEITEKIGSIIVPERHRHRPQEAEVITIGDQVTDIEVGMRVLVGKFAGTEIMMEGETYTLVWQDDVMGILR